MLDLRKSVVESFWSQQDHSLARILAWMESMEDWMLDEHGDIAEALQALVPKMEAANRKQIAEHAEEWLALLAYLSSSRALRIIEWMDRQPRLAGSVVDLIQTAQSMPDNLHGQLLVDRLGALKNLRLLSRIFSPQRLQTVTALLRRAEAA